MYKLIFEGGGVKGIAYVGVLKRFEELGLEITSLAGSSAGAIIASLVACGYNAEELEKIMLEFDFTVIKKNKLLYKLPYIGKLLNLRFNYGIYSTHKLEEWLSELYEAKGVTYFSDLDKELKVVTTNITSKKMCVFPDDFIDGDSSRVKLSKIVAMSSCIPLVFEPILYRGDLHVDGGLMSNLPAFVYDESNENISVLIKNKVTKHKEIKNLISYAAGLVDVITLRDEQIAEYKNKDNVIEIELENISSTGFDLSYSEKCYIEDAGYKAAYYSLLGID